MKNKGITLVILVVTIIILMILLGVGLNLTLGENGILIKASKARENTRIAEEEEKKSLEDIYSSIIVATGDGAKITISMQDLNTLIENKVEEKLKEKSSEPIGTIISYMGNNAPEGYLFCDGSIYQISEYPDLAEQIKREFGQYHYYGGDGISTFAVPNLKGEFLRGTGNNDHTNQGNGANVGQHQDATEIPSFCKDPGSTSLYMPKVIPSVLKNNDSSIQATGRFKATGADFDNYSIGSGGLFVGVRPTNTSVLYCIKY